jgi:Exodeoxyribonuclease V, gamma subunit
LILSKPDGLPDAGAHQLLSPYAGQWVVPASALPTEVREAVIVLLDKLIAWLADWQQGPHSVKQWIAFCQKALAHWSDPLSSPPEVALLQRDLAGFKQWPNTALDTELEVTGWFWVLEQFLHKAPSRVSTGAGITVAELGELSGMPFRVVIVLGLQSDQFPTRQFQHPLDPLSANRRLGDPDPAATDRASFLEALLCATDRILLSWSSREPDTLTPNEPCLQIQQLQQFFDLHFGSKALTVQTADLWPLHSNAQAPQPVSEAPFIVSPLSAERISTDRLASRLALPIKQWWERQQSVQWPYLEAPPAHSLAWDTQAMQTSLQHMAIKALGQGHDLEATVAPWLSWPGWQNPLESASLLALLQEQCVGLEQALSTAGFSVQKNLWRAASASFSGGLLMAPPALTVIDQRQQACMLLVAKPSQSKDKKPWQMQCQIAAWWSHQVQQTGRDAPSCTLLWIEDKLWRLEQLLSSAQLHSVWDQTQTAFSQPSKADLKIWAVAQKGDGLDAQIALAQKAWGDEDEDGLTKIPPRHIKPVWRHKKPSVTLNEVVQDSAQLYPIFIAPWQSI